MSATRPRRRGAPLAATAVAALLLGAAGGWSLHTVLRPADDPLEKVSYTFTTVQEGDVGSSISLNTTTEWPSAPIGANQMPGIVTSINIEQGAEVTAGTTLYTVDLAPVTIASGATPSFRDIGPGAKGADVAQMQEMLKTLGHYTGPSDGTVGTGTTRAIREWQKKIGVPLTGTVAKGSVIFVPDLPARIVLDREKIEPGMTLSGGEKLVRVLPPSPRFRIAATEAQAQLMTDGTPVEIEAPGGATWSALTAGQERDTSSNTIYVALTGTDTASPCGEECASIPVTEQTLLRSRVVTVPETHGMIVPSAALLTAPDGSASLVDANGTTHPVTVLASARGMSAVEGIDAGLRIRVPATSGRASSEADTP